MATSFRAGGEYPGVLAKRKRGDETPTASFSPIQPQVMVVSHISRLRVVSRRTGPLRSLLAQSRPGCANCRAHEPELPEQDRQFGLPFGGLLDEPTKSSNRVAGRSGAEFKPAGEASHPGPLPSR